MNDKPDFLASGEKARLIPVVADTSKERRAASVLLAAVMSVPEFARILLRELGLRYGSHSNVHCYTEVIFKGDSKEPKFRPDGLIVFQARKQSWTALVEAKIRKATLDEEQIAKYCQLAKQHGLDAILTLSNQFAALPTHHPVKLPRSVTRLGTHSDPLADDGGECEA